VRFFLLGGCMVGLVLLVFALWRFPSSEYIFLPDKAHP
jgi:hypothetical protein